MNITNNVQLFGLKLTHFQTQLQVGENSNTSSLTVIEFTFAHLV